MAMEAKEEAAVALLLRRIRGLGPDPKSVLPFELASIPCAMVVLG